MSTTHQESEEKTFLGRAFEVVIRIGTAGLLLVWCFQIAKPFLTTIVWGIIISVASRPSHKRLKSLLRGRGKVAAAIVTISLLIIFIVPTILLSGTMIGSVQTLSARLQEGAIQIPPLPENVSSWPLIGSSVEATWELASTDFIAVLSTIKPAVRSFGRWLLTSVASAGIWVIQFILAIIISGVLLSNVDSGRRVAEAIAKRLADEKGPELLDIANATVQNVTRGILSVAIIQSILAGAGMFVVGVPGAGLWSLLVLVVAIIQLPPILILGPIILYVFAVSSTLTAVIFAIWTLIVGSCDTFLKPVLLGRGAPVPMLIIFIGAIGGFIASGIIGLFVGAVIFSLGYQLFVVWLKMESAEKSQQEGGEEPTS